MAGTTTELALSTAVDTDDTADYLTLNLANSLRTIDALFNNVTGHTHASAHQGGPIAATSLKGPMDFPDWFRSTGHTTAYASTGVGIEMYFNGTQGVIQSYNRATAGFAPTLIWGSTITIGITGSPSIGIAADQTVTLAGGLVVNGAGTMNSTFAVAGATNLTGTLTCNAITNTTLTASGTITGGVVNSNGSMNATGTITGGTVNSSGGMSSTTRITAGTDLVVSNSVIYLGSQGDTTLQRNGANSIQTSGALAVNGNMTVADGVSGITINMSGTLATWQKSNRSGAPSGESMIANYFYVPGDIYSGLRMYAISFNTIPSNPALKTNMTPLTDTVCMTRVRANVPVYQYQVAGTPDPDAPQPTPNEIGLSAPDVYASSPEFATLDDTGTPVGLNYANMSALLWGALRDLDARCTAYGVPA